MKNWIARLLCLALFSSQSVLPTVHEFRVAQQEAGHHLDEGAGPQRLTQADPHDHHDAHDCRVCVGVTQARLECPAAPSVASPSPSFAALIRRNEVPASSSLLASAAPRGPPQA
jgi:hypothetical protein